MDSLLCDRWWKVATCLQLSGLLGHNKGGVGGGASRIKASETTDLLIIL